VVNCLHGYYQLTVPNDIALALQGVSPGTLVCVFSDWSRFLGEEGGFTGDYTDQSYEGCPYTVVNPETHIAGFPLHRPILLQQNGDKFRYYTPEQKAAGRVFSGECGASPPPGPVDEVPTVPPIPQPAPGPIAADCCSTLADILREITEILRELKEPVRGECNSACDTSDACIADIADKLCKQHGICAKTCGECCDELKLGVTLSTEDAATCSRCACEDTLSECSMAGLQPGERCPNCGEEPCCCTDKYTCEPCEPEPDKKRKYVGWCDSITGVIVVLLEGEPSPGSSYTQASIAETEEIAFAEAERYCQKKEEQPKPPSPPPGHPSLRGGPLCDYDTLRSDDSFANFIASTGGSVGLAYFTDIIRTTSDSIYSQLGSIPVIGPVAAAIQNATAGPIASAYILADDLPGLLGCQDDSFAGGLRAMTAIGLYSKWTGADLTGFADTLSYSMNAICRRKHLDPDKAIAAWLTGSIDDKLLDHHWAIAGLCEDALTAYKFAAESKPIPLELITMRFREIISDSEYYEGMQRLGYKHKRDADNLYERQKPLPTLADIVHFMVRDADDETADGPVKRFGLDSNFDDKYAEQLKKWSAAQGIDPLIARYAWRSHWTIPAPGQLFQFWHRLRKLPGYERLEGDIKAALIQQDILPYWHNHFLAVSFRPMGRVDVRRAFNIGAIDDKRVTQAYSDLGYDDKTADDLTRFSVRLRDEAAVGNKAIKLWLKFAIDGQACSKRMIDGGLPADVVAKAMVDAEIGFKQSFAAKAYTSGEIPRERFMRGLTQHGVSFDGATKLANQLGYAIKVVPSIIGYEAGVIDEQKAIADAVEYGMAVDRAESFVRYIDAKIDKQGAIACQRGIKEQFLLGALNGPQAQKALEGNSITHARATRLVAWWECERKATGKAIAANTLCEWRARGAIGALDFRDRLVAVGYTEADALNLITDCEIKVNAKRMREDKQRIEDEARAAAKRNADAAKTARRLEQLEGQAKRASDAAKATLARRQGQMLRAADKTIKKCGCDVGDAVSFATSAKARLQSEFGLSVDEALQALLLATDTWDGSSFDSLTSLLNYHAQLIVDEATASAEIGPLPSSSSNGDTRPVAST